MTETNPLLTAAVGYAAGNIVGGGNNNEQKEEEPPEQYSGICGCYYWFKAGPYCIKERLTFMGWCLAGILAPVFYAVYLNQSESGLNIGFILCCTLAIVMSIYATLNFRDVIKLRDSVEQLCNNTKALAAQRDKIRNEVSKLQTAHIKLEGIEEELAQSNGALRKNFKRFEQWNQTIKEQTEKSKNDTSKIKQEFKSAITQYKKMLIQNEKAILDKAYQHVQYGGDGKEGLNKDEFEDLLNSLPARYRLRLERLGKTFEDFAGDDYNIDQDEFRQFMTLMAEEEANCDMNMPEYGIGSKGGKRTQNFNRIDEDDDDDDDGKDDEKTGN